MSRSGYGFVRKPAPQHSLDRNYEATRPQRGESLYEWATTDYFQMHSPMWLNPLVMSEHKLKVIPKLDKFMLRAKKAETDCFSCNQINSTRRDGEPKIPCIVSDVDSRCALCIVTKQKHRDCASRLPRDYSWPINTSDPAQSPSQQGLLMPPCDPVSPRSTSPAWTFDNIGESRPRRQSEVPRKRVASRSTSPVSRARYFDCQKTTSTSTIPEKQLEKLNSEINMVERPMQKRFMRASTVGPGSKGDDGRWAREENGHCEVRLQRNTSEHPSTTMPFTMERNASLPDAIETAGIIVSSNSITKDVIQTGTTMKSPTRQASTSASTLFSKEEISLISSDSSADYHLENSVKLPNKSPNNFDKFSRFAQQYDEFIRDCKLEQEKIAELQNLLAIEQKNNAQLKKSNQELESKLLEERERFRQAQPEHQEVFRLKSENQRLQTILEHVDQSWRVIHAHSIALGKFLKIENEVNLSLQ